MLQLKLQNTFEDHSESIFLFFTKQSHKVDRRSQLEYMQNPLFEFFYQFFIVTSKYFHSS